MSNGRTGVLRPLRRFLSDRRGNATLEFVVLVFPLVYLIFTIVELGVYMTRSVMVQRGLDITMREVRLGLAPGMEPEDIKRSICDDAFLLVGCEEALQLEVTPLDDVDLFGSSEVNCQDRTDDDIEPVTTYDPGGASELMFVRACLVVNPIFPGVGLGAKLPTDASGGYAIVAETAFVNEP